MKLRHDQFANFVEESFSQSMAWVKDRNLSNIVQINLSPS